MKVHEIMTAHARSVGPENTLVEVAGLMRELDVGALPVVDQDEIAGIVTDRDLVVRGIADSRDPASTTVRDVMSGGTVSIFADQEVEEAARLMEQHQIRRLPVIDRAEKLVGIIALADIATSSNPAFSGIALRDVSEPNKPSARRTRLERESETARMPAVPGARRGPAGNGRRGSGSPAASRRSEGASKSTGSSGGRARSSSRAGSSGRGAKSASASAGRRGKKASKRSR